MQLQAKLNLVEQNWQKQIATGFYLKHYFVFKQQKGGDNWSEIKYEDKKNPKLSKHC